MSGKKQPSDIRGAALEAQVDVIELMGNEVFLHLLVNGTPFLARVDPRTKARPGNRMQVVFDMDRMHAFDRTTEEAIPFTLAEGRAEPRRS